MHLAFMLGHWSATALDITWCFKQKLVSMDSISITAPVISVIMPAYNAEATISDSICSVISQSFADWELIVYDDGSADNTASVVEEIAVHEPRLRFYTGNTNSGVANARNAAINIAQGKWLAFLDSDDLWHKEKLEKQLHFAESTGAVITYTSTSYMNEHGKVYNYVLPAKHILTYNNLLRSNIMSCSSVMVRRSAMIPFPIGFMHEDYAVWMQIVKSVGHAYGLDKPLLVYRLSTRSKSSGRVRSARMIYFSYKQVGYTMLTALFLTVRYAFHSITKRSVIHIYRGERA